MKKRTIIPAIVVMGFFAGCDWASWCSCSKKAATHVEQHAAKTEHSADNNPTKALPTHDEESNDQDHTPQEAEQEDEHNSITSDDVK